MKVGFKVDRIGYYRMFGPLIETALREGASVVLLHRDLPTDRIGEKSYQYAEPSAVPVFGEDGRPPVRQWASETELVDRTTDLDALVTLMGWQEWRACEAIRDRGAAWISLQEAFEFPYFPIEMLLRPDRTCMFSSWWVDLVGRTFPATPGEAIRARLVATGWPELDIFHRIGQRAARTELGLDPSRPVVALGTYKFHADDAWEQVVFRRSGFVDGILRGARRGRLDLITQMRSQATYADVLRAVRRFCDRNGAQFLSKSRLKDRPPELETQLADVAVADQTVYPPTIAQAATAADVFISFASTVALESVYAGCFALCPRPASSWLDWPRLAAFRSALVDDDGSIWNYPGVAMEVSMERFVALMDSADLSVFRSDAQARDRYLRKYVTEHGSGHANRVWSVLEEAVSQRRLGSAVHA